jgi:hypothetical protein
MGDGAGDFADQRQSSGMCILAVDLPGFAFRLPSMPVTQEPKD